MGSLNAAVTNGTRPPAFVWDPPAKASPHVQAPARRPPHAHRMVALHTAHWSLTLRPRSLNLLNPRRTGYITTSSPRAMFISQVGHPRTLAAPAAPTLHQTPCARARRAQSLHLLTPLPLVVQQPPSTNTYTHTNTGHRRPHGLLPCSGGVPAHLGNRAGAAHAQLSERNANPARCHGKALARPRAEAAPLDTQAAALTSPLAAPARTRRAQVGVRGTPYENPFADIYRSMALLGTQGFGSLPRYCALLMGVFFVAALAICGLRDALPRRYAAYVPSPMSMG